MTASPQLLVKLAEARAVTDRLFQHLDPSALYDRPIAERHRMIFYLGHLEAFDWNQMMLIGMESNSPVPHFDNLFAFGIDPEPGKLPHDQPSDWPRLPELERYNLQVRAEIDRHLPNVPEQNVRMLIEHRHMHAETFAYILHNLSRQKKSGPTEPIPVTEPVKPQMRQVPAGKATLGMAAGSQFGWDNEFTEHQMAVPQFAMTRYKISNGEYLEFMKQTGASAPFYWFQQNGQWWYRGMFEDLPLPVTFPVCCSRDQASAYARFRKLALPTEAQFHRAAFGTATDEERALPWEQSQRDLRQHGNFGYAAWNPIPVNASPLTESGFGIAQLVGNGWEWTSTIFEPFPGFEPSITYPAYSANFFDNSHYVLKGASQRTSATLVRRSLRNWFRPDYPYVYATFHLVQN
jgi:iron(II)-dependent oxidoreductase